MECDVPPNTVVVNPHLPPHTERPPQPHRAMGVSVCLCQLRRAARISSLVRPAFSSEATAALTFA